MKWTNSQESVCHKNLPPEEVETCIQQPRKVLVSSPRGRVARRERCLCPYVLIQSRGLPWMSNLRVTVRHEQNQARPEQGGGLQTNLTP